MVKKPARPEDEAERLSELHSLDILDSGVEERFDRITRLAQRLFNVPIALVTLVDDDRQWFKSRRGVDVTETPRDVSFCGHAILGDDIMTVPDATLDDRFFDNPMVVGDPGVRFYAGCPITGPKGATLGTLCIIDRHARELSLNDEAALRDLAEMVEHEIAVTSLAVTDALTGLSNRRGFELAGTMVTELSRRHSINSTLLYMDVDHFKSVNDTFGHDEGDKALEEFAQILTDVFRRSDVVARLGGDEFAVLLADASGHHEALERLTGTIEERNRSKSSRYELHVSIGVATFDSTIDGDFEQFVNRADRAMYKDKGSKGQGSPRAVD
jgi:diguanylate cyclase (GGDEF)-like protein